MHVPDHVDVVYCICIPSLSRPERFEVEFLATSACLLLPPLPSSSEKISHPLRQPCCAPVPLQEPDRAKLEGLSHGCKEHDRSK